MSVIRFIMANGLQIIVYFIIGNIYVHMEINL